MDLHAQIQHYWSRLIQIVHAAPQMSANDYILFKDLKQNIPVLVRVKQAIGQNTYIVDKELNTNSVQPIFFLPS